jgi:Ca2+-binding RTX toxin-like protein
MTGATTDPYEQARTIVESASKSEFVLPEYTGAPDDLAYMRQWVIGQVTQIYSVDASLFDTATVVSTTILRDFIHRALYQTRVVNNINDVALTSGFLGYDDVAVGFRYPSYGLCGLMALQELGVFRAMGYETNKLNSIDLNLDNYGESHVMTQVYVVDLGKYIVQDSTFNSVYRDASGTILSFYEVRKEIYTGGAVEIDNFDYYREYYRLGVPEESAGTYLNTFVLEHYFRNVWNWVDVNGNFVAALRDLYLKPDSAHNPAVFQGGVFSTREAAVSAVENLKAEGLAWHRIAESLRDQGYYVSGFAPSDPTGARLSEWLTVRLQDGRYLSLCLQDGATLNGSYDQLITEATGGEVLNSGVDLSVLLGPAYLLSIRGAVMNPGVALPVFMTGSPGDDVFVVNTGQERISEAVDGGRDTVYAHIDFTMPTNVEVMRLQGFALRGDIKSGEGSIYGNENDNTLLALGGIGHLYGGVGDDVYRVDHSSDTVNEFAGEGTDTIYASGDYVLPIHVEILNLVDKAVRGSLGAGSGWIYGNAQDNVLDARGASGRLFGGAGNDTYLIDSSGDTVNENPGQGVDTVISTINHALGANVENLTLEGTASLRGTGNALANTIIGNAGANALSGGAGDDRLDGGAGADTLTGGLGNDNFYVDVAGDVVVELAGEGSDTVYASVDFTMPANVEIMNLKGAAIRGAINSGGDGWIYGNGNANVLDARGGVARLYGGLGDDTYFVDGATDQVIELAGEGVDTVRSSISYTLPVNVEGLVLEGTANLNGTGNVLANSLTGNAGHNVLNGGAGADVLTGGAGNDSYYADSAGDTIIERAGEGTDTLYSTVDFVMPAHVEVLNLKGAAIRGTINVGGDGWIYGTASANILDARGGTARLYGGAGDDAYFIDSSGDRVIEAVGEGVDTVTSTISHTLTVNVENLVLGGAANLTGVGNALDNRITGNAGANVLRGEGGADTLVGGAGADTLTGGAGADRFVFLSVVDSTPAAPDRITDFLGTSDLIDLSAIDAIAGTAENEAFNFVSTFDGRAGQAVLTYNAASNTSTLMLDINGDGSSDFVLFITGQADTQQGWVL